MVLEELNLVHLITLIKTPISVVLLLKLYLGQTLISWNETWYDSSLICQSWKECHLWDMRYQKCICFNIIAQVKNLYVLIIIFWEVGGIGKALHGMLYIYLFISWFHLMTKLYFYFFQESPIHKTTGTSKKQTTKQKNNSVLWQCSALSEARTDFRKWLVWNLFCLNPSFSTCT